MLFDRAQLDKFSQEMISKEDIPPDHTIAVIGTVTAEGVKAAVVLKKDTELGQWQFQGAYQHDWDGNDSVGAKVIFSK